MAASKSPKERARRRRLPLSEKQRIVELSLRGRRSIRAIAGEHGVSRNTLRRWQELYRAGKLATQPRSRGRAGAPTATLCTLKRAFWRSSARESAARRQE